MELWKDFESSFVQMVARGAGKVVARAATAEGARKPIAWALDAFFIGIADELERQGVSRRVAAGMFGVSRRTYLRRVQVAEAGARSTGESLWWSVLQTLRNEPLTREDVLTRFARRPAELVGAVLFDMLETRLITERDGLLVAIAAEETWTDARLTDLLTLLAAAGKLPPLSDLAGALDVEVARIESLLDESQLHSHIPTAEHEPLWRLLTHFVEQTYTVAYRELSGENTDTAIYRLNLTPSGRQRVPQLRKIVESARAQAWNDINEFLQRHGSRDPTPGESVFTVVVSHLEHAQQWFED